VGRDRRAAEDFENQFQQKVAKGAKRQLSVTPNFQAGVAFAFDNRIRTTLCDLL
jgi:hypothetical protein